MGNLLDMLNDELMQAGNGVGERGAWVAVAGFHAWGALFYEWINGTDVVMYGDVLPSAA